MTCFIKFSTCRKSDKEFDELTKHLKTHPALKFVGNDVNYKTQEVTFEEFTFKPDPSGERNLNLLKVNVSNNTIRFELKSHHLYNYLHGRKPDNKNDFYHYHVCWLLKYLVEEFDLNLGCCVIENLEFGANIFVGDPHKTLQNIITCTHATPCYRRYNNKLKGTGIEIKYTQYLIKAYIKGNLLRLELKFTCNQYLKKNTGVGFISDLLDYRKLQNIKEHALEVFDKLVIIDGVEKIKRCVSDTNEREDLISGRNKQTWDNLKGQKKRRFKNKFYILAKKHNLLISDKIVKRGIKKKLDKLLPEVMPVKKPSNVKRKIAQTIIPFSIDVMFFTFNYSKEYDIPKISFKFLLRSASPREPP